MGKSVFAFLFLWNSLALAAPCEEYLLSTDMGDASAHLIGVDTHYSYYFDHTRSSRGHIWRHAHENGPIVCEGNPLCLEVLLQEGNDCQSHAIINLLTVLDRRGALPPSWLRDQLRSSREETLNALVERLFVDGGAYDDDFDIHENWRDRVRAFLRRSGVRFTKEVDLTRLRAVDDLYNAVEGGEVAFINMSFRQGSYRVRDLDDPDTVESRRGAFVRTPHTTSLAHAVAAVGAFRSSRGHRYLVILDSNTASFSTWNVDELADEMRRNRRKVGLYEYMLVQPR